MIHTKKLMVWLTGALFILASNWAYAEDNPRATIRDATDVLNEVMAIPETSMPPSLLKNANGLAIIPNVVKAGFIVAGTVGAGVVTIRGKDGKWANPSFMSLAGGSVGFQIGAQATDVVLVFKHRRSVDNMVDGKFTLGADAAVAAGPVGRKANAATDMQLKAEIYAYSRSKGLFAGISLEGTALEIDDSRNANYYGGGTTAAQLFSGKKIQRAAELKALFKALKNHVP